MKNQIITQRLVEYYQKSKYSPLSYNELVMGLKLNKKEKALLSETLQALAEEGSIKKKNRKYHYIEPVVQAPMTVETKRPSPKLIEGIFDATPLAKNLSFAFVRTEQGDLYVNAEDTLNAYHGDKVLIEPHFRQGKKDFAYIRRIVTRANEILAGDVRMVNKRICFICSNPKVHNWFEISDIGNGKEADKVVLQVTNWGNPLLGKMPVGKVIEVLGPAGDPEVELLAVIKQYQLDLEFSDEVIAESQAINPDISDDIIRSRADYRDLLTFTIDPITAKDFDDAISLEIIPEGWRLYVHIADVAHYIDPKGAIFTEAAKRGNSFYFPKKVIPMLPEILSNKICSLRPEEEKLTLSVVSDIDHQGKVRNQRMVESVIRSNYRLSYEQVDELFEKKNHGLSTELVNVLEQSRALSEVLSQNRLKQGYIFFDLPELNYEYDDNGFIHRFTLAEETESHKLIENFMLVANEFTAKKLTELSPTLIYRIHEDPDPSKIEKLIELLSYYGISYYERSNANESLQYLLRSLPGAIYHKVFDRIILRSMKKAKYTTEHIRHFGLGIETYTHFTSPIRRLCDLIIHYLCKTYVIRSSKLHFGTDQIRHFAFIASEQEIRADQAERDIEKTYSMSYLKQRIGDKFSGIVVSVKSSGLVIMLNEIPVNAVLISAQFPKGRWIYKDREMRFVNSINSDYYQLMDKVLVQIIDVSDDIYLEFQQAPDAHSHQVPASGLNEKTPKAEVGAAQTRKKPGNAIDYKRTPRKMEHKKQRNRGKR